MGKDSIIYLWTIDRCPTNQNKIIIKCTHEIKGHKDQITALSWTNQDDKWLMSCSFDTEIKIWDTKKGNSILKFTGHKERVL